MILRTNHTFVTTLLFIVFSNLGFSQKAGGPADIKINLAKATGKVAKIIGYAADQTYLADTIIGDGNFFQYKNPKGLYQGFYYIAWSDKEAIQLMLDEDQTIEISVDLSDQINTIKIDGSLETSLLYYMAKRESPLNTNLNAVLEKMRTLEPTSKEYIDAKTKRREIEDAKQRIIDSLLAKHPNSLFVKYKSGGQNPKLNETLPDNQQVTRYRYDFWNNVDFDDERLLYTPMINNKLKRYFSKDLMPQNHDTIIAGAHHLFDKVLEKPDYYKFFVNWLLFNYEPGKCSVMDAEAIFVDITRNYVTKERAVWAEEAQIKTIAQRANEMAQSRLNQQAPDVISFAPDGTTKRLYDSKSEYIIVYMYNPDCEHCQEESPKLLEFFHKNRDKVDVFAIALDTDAQKWNNYIQKVGMDWTNVHDPSNRSIYGKYWVDITPEIYLINKDRKIIGKNLKTFQIPTVIEQYEKTKQN
jgi:thiol-disulfide isomerase/thioredoxin